MRPTQQQQSSPLAWSPKQHPQRQPSYIFAIFQYAHCYRYGNAAIIWQPNAMLQVSDGESEKACLQLERVHDSIQHRDTQGSVFFPRRVSHFTLQLAHEVTRYPETKRSARCHDSPCSSSCRDFPHEAVQQQCQPSTFSYFSALGSFGLSDWLEFRIFFSMATLPGLVVIHPLLDLFGSKTFCVIYIPGAVRDTDTTAVPTLAARCCH